VEILEESMEGKHLVTLCTFNMHNKAIQPHALNDCRATGIVFIEYYLIQHYLRQYQMKKLKQLSAVINGKSIPLGDMIYMV